MSSIPRVMGWLLVCSVVGTAPVAAQDALASVRDEIAELRAEVVRLRAEVDALRSPRVGTLTLASSPLSPPVMPPDSRATQPEAAQQVPDLAPAVELLQTQVAELAQVKVESTSRMPVKVFGTIHTHAFANTKEANWLDSPNLVSPTPADGRTGSFSTALRQTRLGFSVDGPSIGSARASGIVAMDFFGGIPGFQTGQVMGLPRLLVAFARLEGEHTALEVGQDHVILAPRDPTSLAAFSFPALFRSGNLYLRAPQARIERELLPGVRIMGALQAPVGGDVPGEDYRFVPPALGGERSRRPAYEAHLGYASGESDAKRLAAFGVSGHFGQERRGETLRDSWAGALDFAFRRDWIGVTGEAFVGDNIDAFGGALGLDARAAGGWAELQIFPSDRLGFHAGVGIDELQRIRQGMFPRRRNRSAFGNVIYALTPEIEASFEYRWLGTLPGSGIERRNHHLDWVIAYKF